MQHRAATKRSVAVLPRPTLTHAKSVQNRLLYFDLAHLGHGARSSPARPTSAAHAKPRGGTGFRTFFGLDDNSKSRAGTNSRAGATSSRVSVHAANKTNSRETNSRPGRRRLRSLIEHQRRVFRYQPRDAVVRPRRLERN